MTRLLAPMLAFIAAHLIFVGSAIALALLN
jgi:hypothetical protein